MQNKLIDELIKREGGYVNDSIDAGGETNYGITKRVAEANGYAGNMRSMPIELAQRIYRQRYWDLLELDTVKAYCPEIVERMFDMGVNMGQSRAGCFLQRSLNVLNKQGTAWRDITVDGDVGNATLSALHHYMMERGDGALLNDMLRCLEGTHYIESAECRPANERFVYGWFKNRVAL